MDPSYNRMSAIAIGGNFVNNIDTSYGLVSLDVSGHTFLRGNLYVGGATNITGNGGFTGNDLTLSGNLTIGKNIYSTGTEMNIRGNGIVIDVSNGATFLTGNADMLFQSGGAGSLYFQTGGNGNLVFGAGNGTATFDASGDGTFISRKGTMTIQADKEDVVLFGAGVNSEIRLETDTQDIVLNPRGTGVLGTVVVNGEIELLSGIKCTEATNTLYVLDTNYFEVIGSTGAQIDLFQTGSVSKSVTLGLNTSTNNGYIGSAGTNVDFAINAGRYLRLTNPLYCDYTPVDITQNYQIGWTQNSNTGNTYSGTASDSGTPNQVGTFNLPSFGVWLIQFNCLLTLNTGSDTITDKGITLSDTSGSNTPCAPGFRMTDPIDDAAGGSGARQTYSFSGIYHYTTPGTAAKYINVYAVTSGSRTVTASGSYKYTRIA